MKRIDITGCVFGRLTALRAAASRGRRTHWVFRCECGVEKEIDSAHVRFGRIRSCGCLLTEVTKERAFFIAQFAGQSTRTHGRSKEPTYFVWKTMKARCCNPNSPDYEYYGGRGIKVCDRWLNDYEAFMSDMGERPDGLTLERRDTNGNYEPGNCYWATWSEQVRNRRKLVRHKAAA